MKLLMIVPHYSPDLGPSAPLFTMLSRELAKRGHQVYVLTTVPHYPSGIVPEAYCGKFIQKSVEEGIQVIRVRIPSMNRRNLFGRMMQFLFYQFGAAWAGLSLSYECAFVANPGLWVWFPFAALCVWRKKPSIFSIYDVYPEVGIRLGIFRHKWVIAGVGAIEKYCLRNTSVVRIISESFREEMNRMGVPDSRLVMLYDWVDTELIRDLPKENPFRVKFGLSGYFVVLYAGNLGLSQGLETVLITAQNFITDQDMLFVFVGDGAGCEHLRRTAEDLRLTNVRFIPFQPRECLPEVLASADVSLVVLKKGVGVSSLPSKTFSSLASQRPVIASVDEECETWQLIQQAKAGLCTPAEDTVELGKAIVYLRNHPEVCTQLGKNGREWALAHHSPQAAAEKFEQLFQSIQSVSPS